MILGILNEKLWFWEYWIQLLTRRSMILRIFNEQWFQGLNPAPQFCKFGDDIIALYIAFWPTTMSTCYALTYLQCAISYYPHTTSTHPQSLCRRHFEHQLLFHVTQINQLLIFIVWVSVSVSKDMRHFYKWVLLCTTYDLTIKCRYALSMVRTNHFNKRYKRYNDLQLVLFLMNCTWYYSDWRFQLSNLYLIYQSTNTLIWNYYTSICKKFRAFIEYQE
jgi:hypothetical protein